MGPPETTQTCVWYPKGDMFSLGVAFFQLLADRVPSAETGRLGIFQEGARIQCFLKDIARLTATRPVPTHLLEETFPSTLRWLPSMMAKGRFMRPTASQLLELSWFAGSDPDLEKAEEADETAEHVPDEGKAAEGRAGMPTHRQATFINFVEAPVHGKSEEEIISEGDVFPVFTLLHTTIVVVLWFVTAHMSTESSEKEVPWAAALGGLERLFPGTTDLRLTQDCEDYRLQVWRWLSYQFSHVGLSHVVANSVLNLVMGIPLEKLHGTIRAALMYNLGVLGGA